MMEASTYSTGRLHCQINLLEIWPKFGWEDELEEGSGRPSASSWELAGGTK